MLTQLDLPNGTQTTQSYDALQRLTQVVNKKTGGADLNKFAYAYDNRDVRTGVQQQYGTDPLRQVNYSYDGVDQLVGEAATGGATGTNYSNAFSYDAIGNRLKLDGVAGSDTRNVKSSVNALNQLTSVSSTVNGGAPLTTGLAYDVAGNLTATTNADGSKTLYNYDDADRLYRVEKHDAQDAPLSKSEFIYDYASRKAISREFAYTAGAWVQTDEKRRVFDGLDVVQERNAANQVTAQLVRDGNIGGILSRSTAVGASFYGYDGGGNVTLLTDENGNDVGHYRYDAFGNTLEASGARAVENPYRFSSKEYDGASGLYDFGYRFYSPGLGRWINRDPLEEEGGINIYGFVGNNSISRVDDYGLSWNQDVTNKNGTINCDKLRQMVGHTRNELYKEEDTYRPDTDKLGGFPMGAPRKDRARISGRRVSRTSVPYGHYIELIGIQNRLRNQMNLYDKHCGNHGNGTGSKKGLPSTLYVEANRDFAVEGTPPHQDRAPQVPWPTSAFNDLAIGSAASVSRMRLGQGIFNPNASDLGAAGADGSTQSAPVSSHQLVPTY